MKKKKRKRKNSYRSKRENLDNEPVDGMSMQAQRNVRPKVTVIWCTASFMCENVEIRS